MMDISDLEKEEFIQSYLQYRWLDETRNKLIDRFFVIVLATLGARFQFYGFFTKNPGWLLVLYCLAIIGLTLMTRSIVTFRRQQRGHNEFIGAMRERFFVGEHASEFAGFEQYVKGKRVYLTIWMEMTSVLLAILSPSLFLDKQLDVASIMNQYIAILLGVAVALIIFYFVAVPFYRYSFAVRIDWDKN